jgi:serine protease Do
MLSVVKRSFLLQASLGLALVASPVLAQSPASKAPQPLPPLPSQASQGAVDDVVPPAPQIPARQALTPQQLYEHIRRGVVAVERNGIPVAVGTVLGGDGRILTVLSGLGGGEGADVRYADGTAVHAKVGHSDKELDLALLVPQAGKWTDGLQASEADPAGAELRAMIPGLGAHLGPAQAGVKGRTDAHARDGQSLLQMLDVDIKGPPVAGAPLLDSTGSVVGVLVRACKGGAPAPAADVAQLGAWPAQVPAPAKAPVACTPVVVGAPVSAIRSFLSHTPATAVAPAPFLGIRGETASSSVHGVRVVAVAPQSPAEKAGLKAQSDVIAAVDGQPIDSPEKLAEAIGKHAPGDIVKLLVFGGDKFRDVAVALSKARDRSE